MQERESFSSRLGFILVSAGCAVGLGNVWMLYYHTSLFCKRKNGWTWENFTKEVNTGKGSKLSNSLRFYMTYILPIIVAVVYLKGYYDTFAKKAKAHLLVG